MAHILLLTPQLPYPPQQGTSLRNYHIICGLAQTNTVSLLTFLEENQTTDPEQIAPLLEKCATIETVPVPTRSISLRLWQLVTTRQPDMALRLFSPLFATQLRDMLTQRPYSVVQIEGIELARYIPIIQEVSPRSKIVFDNHNAETELQRRNFLTDIRQPKRLPAAVYSWIQVQRLRRFERWACLEVDGVTAVSEADAALLTALVDEQHLENRQPSVASNQMPIVAIPNSIDVDKYKAEGIETIQFDLMFAGKMDYRPNVDAVLWFAERVWPMILAKRPLTTWVIVGQKPHERLAGLNGQANITLTGWVESMLPYWKGATIAVMPFRIGSGTRLKIIEAMASETPIVSTSVGAEGFPVTHGKEVILVNEAQEMATAVLELLENKTKQDALKEEGLTFVQHYDWRQIIGRFNILYQEISRNE